MDLWLFAGLSPRRPWFNPTPDRVGFVTDEVVAYDFLLVLRVFLVNIIPQPSICVRGAALKSLARPTPQYRSTESTVSLEIGACSCAKLQVFSCYRGWKETYQATRAILTTSRRELSSRFFSPVRQGADGNSRHSNRNIRGTCTIVCHRQKLGGPV